jgi:hypothetical protein
MFRRRAVLFATIAILPCAAPGFAAKGGPVSYDTPATGHLATGVVEIQQVISTVEDRTNASHAVGVRREGRPAGSQFAKRECEALVSSPFQRGLRHDASQRDSPVSNRVGYRSAEGLGCSRVGCDGQRDSDRQLLRRFSVESHTALRMEGRPGACEHDPGRCRGQPQFLRRLPTRHHAADLQSGEP